MKMLVAAFSIFLLSSSIILAWGIPNKTEFLKIYDPDGKKDPQQYVKRYLNEPKYKAWFDKNWSSKYKSIYAAVGLSEPTESKTKIAKITCGQGTVFKDGLCIPAKKQVKSLNTSKNQIKTSSLNYDLLPNIKGIESRYEKNGYLTFDWKKNGIQFLGGIEKYENNESASKFYQLSFQSGIKNKLVTVWEIYHLNGKCYKWEGDDLTEYQFGLFCQKNNTIVSINAVMKIQEIEQFAEKDVESPMSEVLAKIQKS